MQLPIDDAGSRPSDKEPSPSIEKGGNGVSREEKCDGAVLKERDRYVPNLTEYSHIDAPGSPNQTLKNHPIPSSEPNATLYPKCV